MRDITATRVRSSVPINLTGSATKVYTPSGQPISGWPKTMSRSLSETTTYDTSTKGYKKLIALGAIITKDYKHIETKVYTPFGTYAQQVLISGAYRDHMTYNCPCEGLGVGPSKITWPASPVHNVDQQVDLCLQKAYSKIDAAEIEQLLILAEFDETVVTLQTVAKGVRKHIQGALGKEAAIRRKYDKLIAGVVRKKKFNLKRLLVKRSAEIANVWLTARFGIRPLYYDLKSVVDALNMNGKRRLRVRYASELNPLLTTVSGARHTVTGTEGKFQVDPSKILLTTVRGGVLVSAELDTGSQVRLQGITNLPEIAWELIPLSFVIDWFVNVGDTLAALTPEYDLTIASSYVTVQQTSTSNFTIAGCSLSKEALPARGAVMGFSYSNSNTVRTRYAYPLLSPIPSCKIRFNTAKAIDAAALLRVLVPKLLKFANKRIRGRGDASFV